MSNASTFQGYYNLPAQAITGTTETALLVPAQGAYPGFPSPALAAAKGLFVGFPADVTGSMAVDNHSFLVRVAGRINTGASSTFQIKLYQVPASIAAASTQDTLANDNVAAAPAASAGITGAANFLLEARFMWDSASTKLNGYAVSQINGAAVVGPTATTIVTVAAISGLNFLPSFTFGTGNAANTVLVSEFVLDRD